MDMPPSFPSTPTPPEPPARPSPPSPESTAKPAATTLRPDTAGRRAPAGGPFGEAAMMAPFSNRSEPLDVDASAIRADGFDTPKRTASRRREDERVYDAFRRLALEENAFRAETRRMMRDGGLPVEAPTSLRADVAAWRADAKRWVAEHPEEFRRFQERWACDPATDEAVRGAPAEAPRVSATTGRAPTADGRDAAPGLDASDLDERDLEWSDFGAWDVETASLDASRRSSAPSDGTRATPRPGISGRDEPST